MDHQEETEFPKVTGSSRPGVSPRATLGKYETVVLKVWFLDQ